MLPYPERARCPERSSLEGTGHFQEVTPPHLGSYVASGPLWRLSRTPLRIRRAASTLGQHDEYVYKEFLGYTDEEYAHLQEVGG